MSMLTAVRCLSSPSIYTVYMNELKRLYALCQKSDSVFLVVLMRYLRYRMSGKMIFAHQQAIIKWADHISTNGPLKVGLDYAGFAHRNDVTYLNVDGRLDCKGAVSIGRGCRMAIGAQGRIELGSRVFINALSTFIIMHTLRIGDDCNISWECQFLDDDFHEIEYEGRKVQPSSDITLGKHVWVGSRVSIYKGTTIADGCVIAANSVVRGIFDEPNALIAGNPARVVKRNVSW
ncbi:acetyltransferase-like isoleucine patch superfamily enzyme [Spirosoma oryzae]|uniref:Acetyltransferase-like isoleucine patch superfamily enzyme n=2 Tax=Spirosoma oryzae TaxID=1469603 RepID=A0A2T0S535_9BACT|nr:acetyltransferase-like isoleucine patch superfamily enzyme [Spirosoma oryzae]